MIDIWYECPNCKYFWVEAYVVATDGNELCINCQRVYVKQFEIVIKKKFEKEKEDE